MSNALFRKKSIDRISSPEQLNEYIRVSTPSVWLVLLAVVFLLVGVCVWGVTGRLDTVMSVAAVVQDGVAEAYVRQADAASLQEGMTVSIGSSQGTIAGIGGQPMRVDESFSEYMRHVGSLQEGEWVYKVTLDVVCPDGVYSAGIITQSVPPMSFILN